MLKRLYPPLLVILIIFLSFLILYPLFSWAYPTESYEDLYVVVSHFGKNLSFLSQKPLYYLYQYGTQFSSLLLAYKFFDFNSKMYFALNILLRITTALSIYYFVSKWSKSFLAGFIAGLFFAINTAGLQATTRVSLFQIYVAAIFLIFFLDNWFSFHYQQTKKKLVISALFFLITIIAHPVRMVGIVPLIFAGEIHFYFKKKLNRKNFTFNLIHSSSLIIVLLFLMFVTGTLATTPELTYKRVDPNILFLSVATGYPPIVMSLWFFISNLIISPAIFQVTNLKVSLFTQFSSFLPFLSGGLLFISLVKRKFLFSFISLSIIIYSLVLNNSLPVLKGWKEEWITLVHIGGVIFLISNFLLLLIKEKFPRLAEIGFIGTLIVITNLIFPWLISPEVSQNDQSAFNLIHRYYTIPSIGMGMLLSSVLTICIYSLKENALEMLQYLRKTLYFKAAKLLPISIILIALGTLIIILSSSQGLTTYNYLLTANEGFNVEKTDLFWNKYKPYIRDLKIGTTNLVIIESDTDIDKKYIKKFFPRRVAVNLRQISPPPPVEFFFNKEDLITAIKNNKDYNLLAYRYKGEEIADIKEGMLKAISE